MITALAFIVSGIYGSHNGRTGLQRPSFQRPSLQRPLVHRPLVHRPSLQRLGAAAIYARAKDSVVDIQVTTKDGMSFGTGFFYGDGKTVATCNHVIEGARKILIRGTHGAKWTPVSISSNPIGDTVLLHLSSASTRIPFATAGNIQIGDPVFIIGNPLGVLSGSLSTGIVSAHRQVASLPLVQTTAPISEGSSGSPLLDQYGRVMGMVSFTFSEGQNLNMAIGSQVLRSVSQDHRRLPVNTLFASNEVVTGAAMKFAPKGKDTSVPLSKATNAARETLTTKLAEYDGRLINAFVRWQEESMAFSRNEGGIQAEDVHRTFSEFQSALENTKGVLDFASNANVKSFTDSFSNEIDAVSHVAEDKFREDAEAAALTRSGKATEAVAKRAATQYGRLVQALCDLGASTEDPTWMDIESLYRQYPSPAKGECVMLHQNAFVDPDLPHSTIVRDALPTSRFHMGDEIVGARVVGKPAWIKVGSWEDLWQFTLDHGQEFDRHGWEVRVRRDGKSIPLSMDPADAACGTKSGS